MLVASETKGLYVNDECYKMALTDAISVACKALGMGADVYWNKDTTKYNDVKRDNYKADMEARESVEGEIKKNAIELARVIDRSLREVRAVDLEALVLRPGEKVWNVWVDVYVLDHDGNLFDASMLATMAALLSAELPDFEELETGEVAVKRGTKGRRLKVDHRVVTVTTAKVGNYIIVDPNFEEEVISDYRLVLSFDENLRIVGAQKTGSGGMRAEELQEAIKVSKEASQIYFKALEQVRGGGK